MSIKLFGFNAVHLRIPRDQGTSTAYFFMLSRYAHPGAEIPQIPAPSASKLAFLWDTDGSITLNAGASPQ